MVAAQGGDPDAPIATAPEVEYVRAERTGVLTRLDARAVGVCAWRLGAGRARKEDPVSEAAGVVCRVKPGDAVAAGDVILELHLEDPARYPAARDALDELLRHRRPSTAAVTTRPRSDRTRVKRLLALAVTALLLAACSNQSDAASPTKTTSPKTTSTTSAPKCTVASDTTLQRIDLDVGGTPRYALVHVPKGWDGTTSLPLVLSFHGLGASAENQMSTDNFGALADRKQFIVAYPAATGGGTFGAAWKFKRTRDGARLRRPLLDAARVSACASILHACLRDRSLLRRRDDRPARRANAPIVFAATAPVSAYLPPRTCDSKVPMPTVSFHGVEDQLLPYAGGGVSQQVAFETWGSTTAARNGCAPKPTESQYRATVEALTWHGCKEPVVLYRVHHNGHTWPGHPLGLDRNAMIDLFSGKTTGRPYPLMTVLRLTPEQFADTITLANQDIDASAMIWDFFSHHTRAVSAEPQS